MRRYSALFGFSALIAPLAVLAQSPVPSSTDRIGTHPGHRNVTPHSACQTASAETQLLRREQALLGPAHAAHHGRVRRQQCDVERGIRTAPAKLRVMAAEATLKDDLAARQAIISSSAPNAATSLGAAAPMRLAAAAPIPPELTQGRWSAPFVIPVVGVTAVLLHTGNVLFWSYDPVNYHNPAQSNDGVAYIWNPTTRRGYNIAPPENIWCAGQTILSDGRVYVAGGNLRYPDDKAPPSTNGWEGTLTNYTFNPVAERWARQPDMARGRWYPSVTQLADNRVLITSGIDETGTSALNNAIELFTPAPNIDGIGTVKVVSIHDSSGFYPMQFLLPSGQMLQAGPDAGSSAQLNPATWNWSNLPRMTSDHYNLGNGISYTDASRAPASQLIMLAGGHSEAAPMANNEWLDGMNPAAGWRRYPQWRQARHNSNTVILPDGAMLTVGGNKGVYGYEEALFQTELYSKPASDTSGTWVEVAPHSIQAAYHSSAILLPDATVLLSEDDMDNTAAAAFQHKAQVYSPPYLFKGTRPKITAAPANLKVGQSFAITTDRSGMASAMLVAPGAVTHGNDMHQRAIKLQVQTRTTGLTAVIPNSRQLVPPGYYMLFVLDSAGIPSVAKFVRIT